MAREKDTMTLHLLDEVPNLQIGQTLEYVKGSFGYNNLGLMRKAIRRRLYTYFPAHNIGCERVYESPRAFVRITRTA